MTLTKPNGAACVMVMSPNVSSGTKRIAPPSPPRDPTVEVTKANAMINTS
jgi:hypothetical protein